MIETKTPIDYIIDFCLKYNLDMDKACDAFTWYQLQGESTPRSVMLALDEQKDGIEEELANAISNDIKRLIDVKTK